MVYRMVLEALGNPDHGENPYHYIVQPKEVFAYTIEEIVRKAREWIDKCDIGAGNWKMNEIWLNDGKGTGNNHETLVGYMSYNGRVLAVKV